MGFPNRNLKQTITHWVATPNGFGGYTYGAPTTQNGRWEESAQMFRDVSGEEVVSKAVVYLTDDVSIGDYLFEGATTEADPNNVSGAEQVRQFHSTPDIRASAQQRVAYI